MSGRSEMMACPRRVLPVRPLTVLCVPQLFKLQICHGVLGTYSCSQASRLSLFPSQLVFLVPKPAGFPCSQASWVYLFTSQLPILVHKPAGYPCSQANRLSLFTSQQTILFHKPADYPCSQASWLSLFPSQ
jgi:hypothetical protein